VANFRRGKKNILTAEEAEKILNPFMDDLIQSVNDGKRHFDQEPASQLVPYRKRTKACMLNDAISEGARKRFDGVKGVKIDDSHESIFFVFEGQLGVRFKKLDEGGAICNVPTERQDKISFQVLSIAGIKAPTLVSFVYKLNSLWTEIVRMKILCKWGDETLWAIPAITGAQAGTLPFDQNQKPQVESGPIVKSTRPIAKKVDGGST
jgi:hypothetical protein